jgi:hypothetical protein
VGLDLHAAARAEAPLFTRATGAFCFPTAASLARPPTAAGDAAADPGPVPVGVPRGVLFGGVGFPSHHLWLRPVPRTVPDEQLQLADGLRHGLVLRGLHRGLVAAAAQVPFAGAGPGLAARQRRARVAAPNAELLAARSSVREPPRLLRARSRFYQRQKAPVRIFLCVGNGSLGTAKQTVDSV